MIASFSVKNIPKNLKKTLDRESKYSEFTFCAAVTCMYIVKIKLKLERLLKNETLLVLHMNLSILDEYSIVNYFLNK